MSYKVSDAFLANKVYDQALKRDDIVTAPDGSQWQFVLASPKSADDYQGVLFKNISTGKYEFVNRGTEPTLGDANADYQMGIGRLPDQVTSARAFLQSVKSYISDHDGNPSTDLSLTGHSLGGSITQVLASENPQLPATAFNPYGVGNLIPEGDYINITNYVMAKDPVSVLIGSKMIGSTEMYTEPNNAGGDTSTSFGSHGSMNFLDASVSTQTGKPVTIDVPYPGGIQGDPYTGMPWPGALSTGSESDDPNPQQPIVNNIGDVISAGPTPVENISNEPVVRVDVAGTITVATNIYKVTQAVLGANATEPVAMFDDNDNLIGYKVTSFDGNGEFGGIRTIVEFDKDGVLVKGETQILNDGKVTTLPLDPAIEGQIITGLPAITITVNDTIPTAVDTTVSDNFRRPEIIEGNNTPPAPSTATTVGNNTSNILNNDSIEHPTYGGGDLSQPIVSDDGYDPVDFVTAPDPNDNAQADFRHSEITEGNDSAASAATLTGANNALNLASSIINLANWDNASDLSHVQTVVGLYNQFNNLAELGMPSMAGPASVIGFLSAVHNGDVGGAIYGGLQMVDTLTAIGTEAGVGIISSACADAIPFVGLILSLSHVEENPLGVVISACAFFPPVGPVIGIILSICQVMFTHPPISEGEAHATFDEFGHLNVITDSSNAGGGSTAAYWMNHLAHGADLAGMQTPQAGAFTAGMPTVGYKYNPEGYNYKDDDGEQINGHLVLRWVDPNGVEHHRNYMGNGQSSGFSDENGMAEDFMMLMHSAVKQYPPLAYETLGDGAGTLQYNYGVATVVYANNTHKFDGQAEHIHGGAEDTDGNGGEAIAIAAGDKRLLQDHSHTVANSSQQTSTVVAASALHTVVNPVIAPIQTKGALIDVGSNKIVSKPATPHPLGFVPLGGTDSLSQERKNATAAMIQSADNGLFGANTAFATALAAAAVVTEWPTVSSAASLPHPNGNIGQNGADIGISFADAEGGGHGAFTGTPVKPAANPSTVDLAGLQLGNLVTDVQPGSGLEKVLAQFNADNAIAVTGYLVPAGISASSLTGAGAEAFHHTGLSQDLVLTYPKVSGELVAGTEDTGLRLSSSLLLGNDSSTNGLAYANQPSLHISGVGNPTHGQVALRINDAGVTEVVFIPDPNYNGTATFSYTVTDQFGLSSTATATVYVESVNDAPEALDTYASGSEDAKLMFNPASLLVGNSFDADGDVLSISAVGAAEHGQVFMQADGSIRFVPDANYNGPAQFTYWVTDGQEAIPTTMHLNVIPVNDLPVVTGEIISSDEDVILSIDPKLLLANDHDVDTDAALNQGGTGPQTLSITAVGGAQHGTVVLLADGTVQFTPDKNYFGPASFTYTVDDGAGGQVIATAVVNLAPVNDAPDVVGESISFDEDEIQTISVAALLANDSDVDNPHADLKIVEVGNATHGTVTLNANGTISYVPDADYFGPAQFTYTVSDGAGGFNIGTATLDIAPVNDAPRLQGEATTADEDQILHISKADLLANDSDVDSDHADLTITGVGHASHGTVSMVAGEIVFTPDINYHGAASFTYTVSDGVGGTSEATVNLTFNSVNDLPVVNDELLWGKRDITYTLSQAALLSNDTDVESPNALTIVGVQNVQHGVATLNPDHSVTFVPEAGYTGKGSFEYVVQDADGGQSTGTSYIDFSHVNVNPITTDDSLAGYQDARTEITTAQLLANDSDPDGTGATTLTVDQVGNAQHGTVELGADGIVRFQPEAGFYGAASFDYRVNDGEGGQTWATGFVTVQKTNSAPVFTSTWGDDGLTINATHTQHVPATDSQDAFDSVSMVVDPTRHWGGYSVADPDGDVVSVRVLRDFVMPDGTYVHTHGHIKLDAYAPETVADYLNPRQIEPLLTASAGRWEYVMDFGDSYHGLDTFAIEATDSHGATTVTYLTTFHEGASGTGGCFPVVVDLQGDGIDLVKPEDSHVFADLNKDGWREHIGWAASTDAVLAFDANADGKIDQANEVSFVSYLAGAKTDMEGLAAFDTDGDGKITAHDKDWAKFGLLHDANGNGVQDEGEFLSLDQQGISSIDLHREGTPVMNNGNVVFGTSTVTFTDGHTTKAGDVMFAGENLALPNEVLAQLKATDPAAATTDAEKIAGNALVKLDDKDLRSLVGASNPDLFNTELDAAAANDTIALAKAAEKAAADKAIADKAAADLLIAQEQAKVEAEAQALVQAKAEAAALLAAQEAEQTRQAALAAELAAKEAAVQAEHLAQEQAKAAADALAAAQAQAAAEAAAQAMAAQQAAQAQALAAEAAAQAAAHEAALADEARIRQLALLFNQTVNTIHIEAQPALAFVPTVDTLQGHVTDMSHPHLLAANTDQLNPTLAVTGTHG